MIDMTRVTTRLSTAQGRSTASPDATPTSPPGSRTARATPSASTRPSPRRPARRGASRAAAGGAAAARRGPLVVLPTLATTAPSRRVPGRVLLGFGQSVRVYWGYHHGPALALPALPRSSSTDLRRDTGPGCLRAALVAARGRRRARGHRQRRGRRGVGRRRRRRHIGPAGDALLPCRRSAGRLPTDAGERYRQPRRLGGWRRRLAQRDGRLEGRRHDLGDARADGRRQEHEEVPGRNGVAVQRYANDLAADWGTPVSPYGETGVP